MKKLLTLLFAAALSTVAMAQTTVTFTVMVDVTDYVAGGAPSLPSVSALEEPLEHWVQPPTEPPCWIGTPPMQVLR